MKEKKTHNFPLALPEYLVEQADEGTASRTDENVAPLVPLICDVLFVVSFRLSEQPEQRPSLLTQFLFIYSPLGLLEIVFGGHNTDCFENQHCVPGIPQKDPNNGWKMVFLTFFISEILI